MKRIAIFWQHITRTCRIRALEAEVARQRAEIGRQGAEIARLRTENRALLNSILGVAGIPPIPVGYSTERAIAAAAHATEMLPATLAPDAAENSAAATADASPRASSPFTQSHSESSTRPLADDESVFRSPPPANGYDLSLGAPLAQPQRARPRNDSLQFSGDAASRDSSVGARYIVPGKNSWRDDHHSAGRTVDEGVVGAQQAGPPGRRPVEPGGSVVPGDDTWHELPSCVEAQGFSPAKTDGLLSPSSLPPRAESAVGGRSEAVAETLSQRQGLSSSPRLVAPPHRRRSWHQINRILEIESARKPVASD
ncbi:MAG TPA: hypothetical protein VEJ38_13400 [Candidatus Acidoferrales bacterium]|nr:hypothetical protein [Candidatus Acidoferrales bacterium]